MHCVVMFDLSNVLCAVCVILIKIRAESKWKLIKKWLSFPIRQGASRWASGSGMCLQDPLLEGSVGFHVSARHPALGLGWGQAAGVITVKPHGSGYTLPGQTKWEQ